MKLPIDIVIYCTLHGLQNELALFLKLRGEHKSGCFFDYTDMDYRKFGVSSRDIFNKRIRNLIKAKFITTNGRGRIWLLSFRNIKNKLKLYKRTRYERIDAGLTTKQLRVEFDNFTFQTKVGAITNKITKRSQVKANPVPITLLKNAVRKDCLLDPLDLTRLSYARVAKMFNCSIGSAHKRVKELVDRGDIVKYNCIEKRKDGFNFRGIVGKVLSNIYEVQQSAFSRQDMFHKIVAF